MLAGKIVPHPKAKRLDSGFMHLTLCFSPDGNVNFYPQTEDPEQLARALTQLLCDHPERILCVAGACSERCDE